MTTQKKVGRQNEPQRLAENNAIRQHCEAAMKMAMRSASANSLSNSRGETPSAFEGRHPLFCFCKLLTFFKTCSVANPMYI